MATCPKNRRYSDEDIKHGFTRIVVAGIEKPQCVICGDVFSVDAMKPSKMDRHLKRIHSQYASKDVAVFRRKAESLVVVKSNNEKLVRWTAPLKRPILWLRE